MNRDDFTDEEWNNLRTAVELYVQDNAQEDGGVL
jgi:hypothetical protein